MCIIDFHTHAFPDALAERAMTTLLKDSGVTAFLDGRVTSLVRSMDERGIEKSVVASIATRPEQFGPILKWSKSIASDRIVPFPSVHPADPEAPERLRIVREEGFAGIKMHPYYQDYTVDEERLDPYYTRAAELGLIVLVHGGFDPAFPRDRLGSGDRFARLYQKFPELKFIAAHLGAWEDWGLVREHLLGKPVLMDLSMAVDIMPADEARYFLTHHPSDYLLYASDSPWMDQSSPLRALEALGIEPGLMQKILHGNARRLLGIN